MSKSTDTANTEASKEATVKEGKVYYKVPDNIMEVMVKQVLESPAKIKDGIQLMNAIQTIEKIVE